MLTFPPALLLTPSGLCGKSLTIWVGWFVCLLHLFHHRWQPNSWFMNLGWSSHTRLDDDAAGTSEFPTSAMKKVALVYSIPAVPGSSCRGQRPSEFHSFFFYLNFFNFIPFFCCFLLRLTCSGGAVTAALTQEEDALVGLWFRCIAGCPLRKWPRQYSCSTLLLH